MERYLAAGHVSVVYEPRRELDIDHHLAEQGLQRRFAVQVPGFAGIAAFLRGSDMLATLPGLLARGHLQGFASVEPPVACPTMPMVMVWHLRHHDDPLHRWIRSELEAVAKAV